MPRTAARLLPAFLLPALVAWGPYRPGGLHAVSLGIADATTAAGTGSVALYANPAAMALVKKHSIELGGDHDGRGGATTFAVSSTDGTSASGVAAGVSYGYSFGLRPGGAEQATHDVRSGLAAGFRGDGGCLFFGGSGRRLQREWSGTGKGSGSGWTGDVGVLVVLGESVRLGAAWRNLAVIDAIETPSRLAAGVAAEVGPVLAAGDASWGTPWGDAGPGSGGTYRLGLAALLGEIVQLRTGYSWDRSDPGRPAVHRIGAGAGVRIDDLNLDLGAAFDLGRLRSSHLAATLTWYLPYAM